MDFQAFWAPQNQVKINQGSSWAKMAPRRCHPEPTWLQDPIFIDFKWIFTSFWNGFFSYMLIDIVTRLRANLGSLSREDVKTRSCGVASARNGIRSYVRGSCSKSPCSLILHSVAHRSAPPCSVHGYARVHTSLIKNPKKYLKIKKNHKDPRFS